MPLPLRIGNYVLVRGIDKFYIECFKKITILLFIYNKVRWILMVSYFKQNIGSKERSGESREGKRD